MKVKFKADLEAPVVRVGGPGYAREFKREEQPFEATETEAQMLDATGLFEAESQPGA